MKTFSVNIRLEREDDGRWSVWAPDLPGCVTWGDTEEEAATNMQEAVRGYIESLIARGLPITPNVKATDEPLVSVTVSAA